MKYEDGSPVYCGICAFSVSRCKFDFSSRISPSSYLAWVVREDWAGVYILGVLPERRSKDGKKKSGIEKIEEQFHGVE